MKKLVVLNALAMALTLVGDSVWAQLDMGQGQEAGQGHGPMSADQRLQMMTKQLNLTADQQQKIKPKLENESQQMQTLRQDTSLSQAERMSKMQQIRQSTNEQIKSALNPDQQQKFDEMMSRHGHGHGGPGEAPPAGQSTPPPQ